MTINWNLKKTNWTILLLGILLTFSQIAFAENDLPEKGIFDLWNYQEVIDLKLTFDLDEVFEDRRGEEQYPADISFKDETGTKQNWQIKISTRGNFRRQMCNEMPPLKINFKKGDLRDAGLADFDDFKLVTHCIEDFQEAKELLLKEFLVYRMFNQLTDVSYRVQLVNITYEDVNTGRRKKQMGFLIEDTAQLRARIGADKIGEMRIIESEKFKTEYSQLVALFQYMIGNADWGLTYSKNIKYLEKDQKVWPVPYDFDFAGLVGAPYMTPSSEYDLRTRFDRVYLGFERSTADLEATIRLFEAHREEIYDTVMELKMLKRSSREDMITYLDTFFEHTGEINFTENWY
jgi:hypothetical protein